MTDQTRVVFDCNTLLQGLAAPRGPAGRCVQLAFDGKVRLFISPHVIEELRDVAARPKVVAQMKLVQERAEEFVAAILSTATLLHGFPQVFRYERDPDDAYYVDLAVAADARLIVSRDKDLLDLMAGDAPEATEFRRRFPELQILTPVGLLKQLGTPG